ncbi:DNA ligase D [Bacillus sp. 1P06AnD]|uniref:DNA ligase D n=1 Tax=Bacillus sp. 1P06AnD TaxID=3132208 RepID=UPI0039A3B178
METKQGDFIVLGMNKTGTFDVGIVKAGHITAIGTFSEGMKLEERNSLVDTMRSHGTKSADGAISIEPGICLELSFEHIEKGMLVNARFISFKFHAHWKDCTWERMILSLTGPPDIKLTHPEKIMWTKPAINKGEMIEYLAQAGPFMLPFLKDKRLTTIRFPDGIEGEAFFQKNCPAYAPDFIEVSGAEGIQYIVCNSLNTLVWLGNQAAIEFHVPFQTIQDAKPNEIVFDLDPPSRDAFPLAIKAALMMKGIFEGFGICSFPKLSGSKGIQIHIPIASTGLTYMHTKEFTQFIATFLSEQHPDSFTTERLKKNRKGRLYLDYVQHAEGKTIIAPYSPRGKIGATVAVPLYWDELQMDLRMEDYTIRSVLDRLSTTECPMAHYFEQDNSILIQLIEHIKEKRKSTP